MSDLMELVNECDTAGPEKGDTDAAISEANYLRDLGFSAAAEQIMAKATLKAKLNRISNYKYMEITDKKILSFLQRKAGQTEKKKADRFDRFISEHLDFDRTDSASQSRGFLSNLLGGLGGGMDYTIRSATMTSTILDQLQAQQQTIERFFTGGRMFDGSTLHVSDANGDAWAWVETPVKDYKAVPPKDVLLKMEEHKARGIFDSFTIASVEKIKDPLLLGRVEGVDDRRFFIAQWGEDIALDDVI